MMLKMNSKKWKFSADFAGCMEKNRETPAALTQKNYPNSPTIKPTILQDVI